MSWIPFFLVGILPCMTEILNSGNIFSFNLFASSITDFAFIIISLFIFFTFLSACLSLCLLISPFLPPPYRTLTTPFTTSRGSISFVGDCKGTIPCNLVSAFHFYTSYIHSPLSINSCITSINIFLFCSSLIFDLPLISST